MTFKLGLTGSIGMGKSTTAQMFVDEGCALWDADAAVHRLYAQGGAAVDGLQAAFPSVVQNGAVSRAALKDIIAADKTALKRVEAIVHPLVAEDRARFLEATTAEITVLDIPLLFETGADGKMDAVVCVTTSEEEQERRVLERGTMTRDDFLRIKSNQLPSHEKSARADFVIETDAIEHARQQVLHVIREIKSRLRDA